MWDLKACRSCLATQHKLEKISETLCRLYAHVTGLQFKPGDGYPNYFCVECITHLKKCLAFRRKSRRAYFALQTTMNINKQITLKDVHQVDRKKNNLISSLDNCNTKNFHCFQMLDMKKNEIPTISITAKDFYNQIENNLFSNNVANFKSYKANNVGHVIHIIDITDSINDKHQEANELIREEVESSVIEETKLDMEDVFKDLSDVVSEHSIDNDTWDAEAIDTKDNKIEIKKKKAKQKKTIQGDIRKSLLIKARTLEHCDLIPQSVDEQKMNMKKRMEDSFYANAKLKCSICIRVYNHVDDLVNHVNYHNFKEAAVPCNVCTIRVRSDEELLIHEAEEHLYLYKCQDCDNVSYTLNEFIKHCKIHEQKPIRKLCTIKELKEYYDIVQCTTEEMYNSLKTYEISNALFECDICYMKFRDDPQYQAHMILHEEPTPKTYMCDVCKIWCKKLSTLEIHIQKFHKYKYTCKICDMVKFTNFEASRHKSKHNIDLYETHTCDDCNKQFRHKRRLKIHRDLRHFDKVFCHHCVVCGASYSSKCSLYQHQMIHHNRIIVPSPYVGEIEFTCVHCNVKFMSEEAYKTHLVKHRHPEAKEIPLSCITCRKIYEDETEYENHFKICTQYPRSCVYCDTVINTPVQSASHYKKVHSDLTHYSLGTKTSRYTLCEHCGKSIYHSRLAAHKMLHDKALPICSHCDKHYSTPLELANHILNKHTVRPYRCSLCAAAYDNRRFARDHILKTHAPVRPFKCNWCPLKFSHVDFMNEHITKIHNAKPMKMKKVKNSSVFCTYPHMKVDISQLKKELIPQITYQICDYHDQNMTTLQDHTKFFMTNPPPLDLIYTETRTVAKKPAKKKRKNNNVEEESKVEIDQKHSIKDDVENDGIDETGDVNDGIDETGDVNDGIGDIEIGIDNADYNVSTIEQGVVIEEIDVKTQEFDNELEIGGDGELVLDPNVQYEVIEEDGNQYVMVNNMLFKIETE